MRLAVFTTHPVQYFAPLFRELASKVDLCVFYQKIPSASDQGVGFGKAFTWDIDLLSGYKYEVIERPFDAAESQEQEQLNPKLATLLRDGDFDAALSLGWYCNYLRGAILTARRLGIPVMVRGDSQHNPDQGIVSRVVKRMTYPMLLRIFSAGLFTGERSREYFRTYGFPDRKLFYSPHAIETERFAETGSRTDKVQRRQNMGVEPNEKLLLFAGKLVPYKRPLVAVETIVELRRLGISARLVVAGTGPLESDMLELAKRIDVPLTTLGFINQSEMPEIYATADALILPSTPRETWGLVANEALACGTPIVVSNEAGCSPDLCDGVAGTTGHGADAMSYALGLQRIWSKSDLSEAVKSVSDRHTMEVAARSIVAAARSILGD